MQGLTAYRETFGKALDVKTAGIEIGKIKQQKPVKADDKSISFEVKLKKGETDLTGFFLLKDGKKIVRFMPISKNFNAFILS